MYIEVHAWANFRGILGHFFSLCLVSQVHIIVDWYFQKSCSLQL